MKQDDHNFEYMRIIKFNPEIGCHHCGQPAHIGLIYKGCFIAVCQSCVDLMAEIYQPGNETAAFPRESFGECSECGRPVYNKHLAQHVGLCADCHFS